MEFVWDQAKNDATLAARGFDFGFAVGIFLGPVLETTDIRQDYGETRMKAVGETRGFILAVVYTDRLGARRIISARRAKRKECEQWRSFVTA
jgi:uncharacterized protein